MLVNLHHSETQKTQEIGKEQKKESEEPAIDKKTKERNPGSSRFSCEQRFAFNFLKFWSAYP